MTAQQPLNANTFKKVVCAIDPYVREKVDLVQGACEPVDQNDLFVCVHSIKALLEEGGTVEDFCRRASKCLLLNLHEFCRDQWVELRLQEIGQ